MNKWDRSAEWILMIALLIMLTASYRLLMQLCDKEYIKQKQTPQNAQQEPRKESQDSFDKRMSEEFYEGEWKDER
jgi:hypothetical protein